MADEKQKTDPEPEETEPYPDMVTALHGEFILFRNDLIRPPTGATKDRKAEDKPARTQGEDGKRP